MTNTRKGQRFGSTLDELRAQKKIDARNAGYRSAERGDSGEEPRYVRWQTSNPEEFAAGRADYLATR